MASGNRHPTVTKRDRESAISDPQRPWPNRPPAVGPAQAAGPLLFYRSSLESLLMKTFGSLFPRTALAVAVALLSTGSVFAQQQAAAKPAAADEEGAPRAKDDNVRLGTITIVGEGNKLGAGQILNEDAAKSRSTVTRSATEKDRATATPTRHWPCCPASTASTTMRRVCSVVV
jgi:hypothetical protein